MPQAMMQIHWQKEINFRHCDNAATFKVNIRDDLTDEQRKYEYFNRFYHSFEIKRICRQPVELGVDAKIKHKHSLSCTHNHIVFAIQLNVLIRCLWLKVNCSTQNEKNGKTNSFQCVCSHNTPLNA